MATGVGLRIAEDECTAAVITDAGELRYVVREAVLHMTDDGDTVLGGEAPENSHSITGFVAAVGDPAGLSVDEGEAYRAEDLYATAVFCLINQTTEFLSGPAEFYATHPGDWPAPQVQSLREALDYLGLRSVVLVSDADLPAVDTAEPGKSFAYDAARAALAAVLATPAGSTPPDSTSSENSTVQTDVIPTVPTPSDRPQAYSQAMPAAGPVTATFPPLPKQANPRRVPLLIVAAVLFGLALGGFGVALVLRGEDAPDPPPVRDAKSDQSTPVLPPTTPFVLPSTTESTVVLPAPPPEPSPEPETTPPPPPPTTPPPPTQSSTPPSVTSTPPNGRTTTPTRTLFPAPPAWMPTDSGWTPPTYTVQIPPPR
ncbi:hypothetical protein [Nocardia bovistercoris]|uniref:Uncharacterized protein n=1 Tax=Nocardia bovistercoris TaxID=2785916 RepID=A0A931N1W7_9NOCA|nr:hypothetical protein [Nocardia bovistercoris]MBH0778865.1 hypothetical protein [Nocardia bovistercoris]